MNIKEVQKRIIFMFTFVEILYQMIEMNQIFDFSNFIIYSFKRVIKNIKRLFKDISTRWTKMRNY